MFARLMGLQVISPKQLRDLLQSEAVAVFDVTAASIICDIDLL